MVVNSMNYSGKDLVLDVVRTEAGNFFAILEEPQNWEVQTRCTKWEVRDIVGHMIDVTEGYLSRWDIARQNGSADALGLLVMFCPHHLPTLPRRRNERRPEGDRSGSSYVFQDIIGGIPMSKIQVQGVHHITFVGSNRETIIDFYEGVLGMPLIMDQPNLDVPEESHLYFDAGDGRLITFFVRPSRVDDPTPNPEGIGNLHHLAMTVSRATYTQVAQRLNERGIWNTGNIDRGFMDSIYFRDPNGQLLELACFKFVPPEGFTYGEVLAAAHRLRIAAGDYAVEDRHLADAIQLLIESKSLSLRASGVQ